MNKEQEIIKEVQAVNKIIMRELDRVCKKNNIRYYLDSGALLGSIRHKGFIPWDDDVDVVFTRAEYNRLMKLPESEWGEAFELYDYHDIENNEVFDYVSRLLYKGVEIKHLMADKMGKNNKMAKYMGIDLFILDNAFESVLRQKLLLAKLIVVYGFGLGHRPALDYSEYSAVQKPVIFILSRIGKLFSNQTIFGWYDKICQSANKKTSSLYFVGNYPFTDLHRVMKKEWYADVMPCQIDDEVWDGPIGRHELLTTLYGDYMQLPPVEDRAGYHFVIVKKDNRERNK
ncbi:MAG: LicD family protein [Eubacteriales bacterium]|nr:LicD family protein [Eubacteriales bacterium]